MRSTYPSVDGDCMTQRTLNAKSLVGDNITPWAPKSNVTRIYFAGVHISLMSVESEMWHVIAPVCEGSDYVPMGLRPLTDPFSVSQMIHEWIWSSSCGIILTGGSQDLGETLVPLPLLPQQIMDCPGREPWSQSVCHNPVYYTFCSKWSLQQRP